MSYLLNDLFDGIYCINLPSSRDRRNHMEKEFRTHNCDAQFIPAICPLDAEFQDAKRRHVDRSFRPRCYCIKKCKHNPRPLRECEIAICLSHLRAYKKIVKNEDQISLVVEDDVVFHDNIGKIIQHVFKNGLKEALESQNPVMVFCGGRNNPGLKINNLEKYKHRLTKNGFYSNYCCILNRACAKILAKMALPVTRPDDSFKRYWIGKGKIAAYHITPSLVGELSAGINVKPIYSRLSKKISRKEMQKTLEKSSKAKPRKITVNSKNQEMVDKLRARQIQEEERIAEKKQRKLKELEEKRKERFAKIPIVQPEPRVFTISSKPLPFDHKTKLSQKEEKPNETKADNKNNEEPGEVIYIHHDHPTHHHSHHHSHHSHHHGKDEDESEVKNLSTPSLGHKSKSSKAKHKNQKRQRIRTLSEINKRYLAKKKRLQKLRQKQKTKGRR